MFSSLTATYQADSEFCSIPPDLRLEFLLKHRATIDAHSRLAIKDAEKQHIDVTRAIFFWRVDDLHQFQRYHDSARWNIAIFIALLTDMAYIESDPEEARSACNNPSSAEAKAGRQFAMAYLAAVLEHHNDAAVFGKREAFVQLWKISKYDLFTFNAAQKNTMKREMKRLTKEWQAELERILKAKDLGDSTKEVQEVYNAKVYKFIGVLIPGPRSQRGPHHLTPSQTIEGLKRQSDISASDMQPGVLLEVLRTNESDYDVAKSQHDTKADVDGSATQDAEIREEQKSRSDARAWPALNFPKISPPDPKQQQAAELVNVRDAIWVLKKSTPKAMLATLAELFPEASVRKPPTDPSAPTLFPNSPASLIPPTFEDMDVFLAYHAPKGSVNRTAQQDPDASISLSSDDNLQTQNRKRSASEHDENPEEPDKKRYKGEQAILTRSLLLPVDESLLRVEKNWEISADLPTAASATSIFGGDEQKSVGSVSKGDE